ncbi:hypothetical protein [Promicromonospora sukumoe]
MTVPGGGFPDGTFGDDLSGLNGLDEASWRAALNSRVIGAAGGSGGAGAGFNGLFGGIGEQVAGAIVNIVSAFFGTYEGDDLELRRFQDKQREYVYDLNQMQDISGYCVLTQRMTESFTTSWPGGFPHYFAWGNQSIGPPPVHAKWHTAQPPGFPSSLEGILFTAPGTWEINAQITSRGTFTVGGFARLVWEVSVIDLQTGQVFSQKLGYNEIVEWHRTYALNHTVVIPQGGRYMVVVGVQHSRTGAVQFPVGDNFSHLKVSRWDLRTGVAPSPSPQPPLPLD